MRAAFFGGIYSNYLALAAALIDARRRGAEAIFCLGDIGGFGPHPDRTIELLRAHGIPTVQGNYDDAVGNTKADCGCGYTDPVDNHFARISYAYTLEHTSPFTARGSPICRAGSSSTRRGRAVCSFTAPRGR